MSGGQVSLEEARSRAWDVVVIGTGMGGSVVAYALARLGHSVLCVEKGVFTLGDHDRGSGALTGEAEEPDKRLLQGWWPHRIQGEAYARPMEMFFPLGCGTGGSYALSAAQLERMLPADFEPKRHHPDAKEANLPERWPVAYDEMVPYYRKAEILFQVSGTQDPLHPDPDAQLNPPPPMSPRDAAIYGAMEQAGLHPYRAHVGCRFVPGCDGCGSRLCPRQCKTDPGYMCLVPAMRDHGACILTECEVQRLEATKERVTGIRVLHRGEEATLPCSTVVLAAGTLMSPGILLRSTSDAWPDGLANRSGMVGRNLMMHTFDQVALQPAKSLDPEGPHKAISANDLYNVKGRKLGNLHSMGLQVSQGSVDAFLRSQTEKTGAWYLKALGKQGRKAVSKVGAKLFSRANIFSTLVEDLPYSRNRITLDPGSPNGMRFTYHYPDELAERNALFRDELERRLKGHLTMVNLSGPENLNYGHVSGTVRAGLDPETSVVDGDHRAHDLENLYVADASAFPTSGGVNPSLTIAANALRVADALHGRLAASGAA